LSFARLRPAARSLWLLALIGLACERAAEPLDPTGPVSGWPTWGGDAGGSRHSPLTQITRENVGRLELAWRFHTGDVAAANLTRGKSVFEATPILDGDTLYFCSPFDRVFALDAETGAQRTPMTYRVRPGGRQFVVVAAGGHGTMGTKLGDELLAYALPER
jgi:quinoprotein glucose dehydrogenase